MSANIQACGTLPRPPANLLTAVRPLCRLKVSNYHYVKMPTLQCCVIEVDLFVYRAACPRILLRTGVEVLYQTNNITQLILSGDQEVESWTLYTDTTYQSVATLQCKPGYVVIS